MPLLRIIVDDVDWFFKNSVLFSKYLPIGNSRGTFLCPNKKDNYTPRESMQSSWCKNFTLNNDNDIFEEEKTLNESEKVLWSKKSTLNKKYLGGSNIKYLPYAL